MDIRSGIEMLTGYIRNSRKNLLRITLISSVVSVFILAGCSYFFLYRYYEKIVHEYYNSLTKQIYFLQRKLINKDSYLEDLRVICESLSEREGVIDVWCTDRFGRLIFSTDAAVLKEYRSKRLPAEYSTSIDRLWIFKQGYPENYIEKSGFFRQRITIPLYPFSRENHDFILGIEAARFIFLPQRMLYIIFFAGGYILFAAALLFLPVYFLSGSSFGDIITQVRVLAGKIQIESEKEHMEYAAQAPSEVEEAVSEELYEKEEEEEKEAERITSSGKKSTRRVRKERVTAGVKEKAEKLEESVEEEVPTPGSAKMMKEEVISPVEEKKEKADLLFLMDKKNALFNRKELILPFVQAVSFVFHSKSPEGCYLSYLNRGKKHLFSSFVYPPGGELDTVQQLDKIVQDIGEELEAQDTSKGIMRFLNNRYSFERQKLDISCVFLDEEGKRAEFISCGTGYALYLKHGGEMVKEVIMDNPPAGEVTEEEFNQSCSYAELKLSTDDIFFLLPQNVDSFRADENKLIDVLKKELIIHRTREAVEIGREIQKSVEEIRKKNRELPETGFALFKFV